MNTSIVHLHDKADCVMLVSLIVSFTSQCMCCQLVRQCVDYKLRIAPLNISTVIIYHYCPNITIIIIITFLTVTKYIIMSTIIIIIQKNLTSCAHIHCVCRGSHLMCWTWQSHCGQGCPWFEEWTTVRNLGWHQLCLKQFIHTQNHCCISKHKLKIYLWHAKRRCFKMAEQISNIKSQHKSLQHSFKCKQAQL